MDKTSIQIQSVLYFNPRENLERTMDSIAKAIEICQDNDCLLNQFTLCYGDASSTPIFSEKDIYWLEKKYENLFNLKYHFFGFNSGTAKGHNFLAKECSAEYIMNMNPDILLAPDYFVQIMKPFENPYLKAGMSEARQTPIEHPKDYNKLTGETSWCSTAGVVFRADLFQEAGSFDETSFFMYCDDVDLSWRIRMLGYKCIYSPSAVIYHAKGLDSNGQVEPTSAEIYYSAEAALFMAHKWSNPSRLKLLLSQFKNSGDTNLQKAVSAFLSKQKSGSLPEPLDEDHKVAKFVGDNYSKHRFVM